MQLMTINKTTYATFSFICDGYFTFFFMLTLMMSFAEWIDVSVL